MRASRAALAIAGASAVFAAALASRGMVNVWLSTGLAGVVAIVLSVGAGGRRLLMLLRPRGSDVARGLLAGVGLAALTHMAYAAIARVSPGLPELVAPLYLDLRQAPGAIGALPLLALVTLAEELVWRGLAVDLLSRRLGPAATGAVATVLYAVPLLASGSGALVALGLACGSVWVGLRLSTGGLAASWLCHLVWGALLFALWPLAVT